MHRSNVISNISVISLFKFLSFCQQETRRPICKQLQDCVVTVIMYVFSCFLLICVSCRVVVKAVTDLDLIDSRISAVYKHPSPAIEKQLMLNIQLYLITLRRFNTMIRSGCTDTKEQAVRLVHSGGPLFLKSHAFYSDDEQAFYKKMNFTDYNFQEYQYYRLDNENEWNELKGQVAELDAVKQNYSNNRFDYMRFSLSPQ